MESSLSTPHCSFVIYLHRDVAALNSFVQDFRGFFQKFPIQYELNCVIEYASAEAADAVEKFRQNAPRQESWLIQENKKFLGRAASLRRGAQTTQAPYIIFPSLELSTPLGDLFKILQTLMTEADLQVCWGERLSKKSGASNALSRARKMEGFFSGILKDRFPKLPADMLCEVGGIRREAWATLSSSDLLNKKTGWYLGMSLQLAAAEKSLYLQTVFIHDSGKRTADFPFWKARFELLRQSVL